jgi:DNA-binding response OmpR family regulator
MPEPDGWRTLQQIREFSSVPILILTALNELNIGQKCLARGADSYLPKPIDVHNLQVQAQALVQENGQLASRQPSRE